MLSSLSAVSLVSAQSFAAPQKTTPGSAKLELSRTLELFPSNPLQEPRNHCERGKSTGVGIFPLHMECINGDCIWVWSPRQIAKWLCIYAWSKHTCINIWLTKRAANLVEGGWVYHLFSIKIRNQSRLFINNSPSHEISARWRQGSLAAMRRQAFFPIWPHRVVRARSCADQGTQSPKLFLIISPNRKSYNKG